MDIISSIITIFILNVDYTIMQSTMETLNILSEQQKRSKEVVLFHLLNTLSNQLLDIGPILKLSKERNIWMKQRSGDWWNRIVNDHFK